MITFIEVGDIFRIDGVFSYAHGCNCAGAMGKGIAVQFKQKFPTMYAQYKKLCEAKQFNLGDVFICNYGNGYVFNLATQSSWRTKAELTAIEQSLEKMLIYASKNNITKIAMPKIGAGLGGLKWEGVKEVVEKMAKRYPEIMIFIVENYGTA